MTKIGISLALLAAFLAVSANAADWTGWRGPTQNGVAYEKNLPSSGKEVLWRVPLGGRSTPVIVGDCVFGINLAGEGVMEQERVIALNLANGSLVWEHRFNVFHTDVPNTRVGWANVVADPETGNIYAHGVGGMLLCLDRDGKVLWSHSLTETVGRISGYGGRTHTPIIDEDRLILSFLNSSFGDQAVGSHRYVAFDKRTGEMLWWSAPGGKPEDTTYSTPVIAVVDGRRLLIAGNADGGIYAINARTGKPVWGFQLSQRGINSSVVVAGYRVYATHSEENHDSTAMGRVVCIDARGQGDVTKTHELWRQDGIEAGYASPLLHGGRLYVMSNSGVLHCLDAESGKPIWEYTVGRAGKGSPVWADGKIYVPAVNAKFLILEDTGPKAKRIDSVNVNAPGPGLVEIFGSPAVAHGKVLLFTTKELICFGSPSSSSENVAVPQMPAEVPLDANAAPASIQVRPCEVLLKPGESVKFRAVALDEQGRKLREIEPQWSSPAVLGTVSASGELQARGDHRGGIGAVSAKFGNLTAAARVRVVPEIPIREDFESSTDLPSWWIGVSKAKYAMETIDGSKVLKKIADDRGPMFNRSHGYITPPLAAGYTVQADVRGKQESGKLGDVGVINARYNLELMGAVQRLRVVSWVPGPRFEKRIDFPWQPDRWYSVKLRVDINGDKALVRAKAWPRGEAEPQAWTIEAEDPQPNREGSAGIYAYSMAPLYFDNVSVQPNQ